MEGRPYPDSAAAIRPPVLETYKYKNKGEGSQASVALHIGRHLASEMVTTTMCRVGVCWIFGFVLITVADAKFPNEIVEQPIVSCEADAIEIKIRTSASNPSLIYAENYRESTACSARHMNKINIGHGECGMTSEKLSKPDGTMYRICIAVQIHPLFVTESDRSYCAQCVYMESNVVDDLEQDIVISEATPSELEPQFDESSNPKCSYSIRKGSIDGPEAHFATIGESVVHVWKCENEHVGILVQNCHVEDTDGNKILIIDQNGCGIDQYVLNTPQYSEDLKTAWQESHVFKFADKTLTRFTCQIRLCLKDKNDGCKDVSPPKNCPTEDEPVISPGARLDEPIPPAEITSDTKTTKIITEQGPPSIRPPSASVSTTTTLAPNPALLHGIPTAERGPTKDAVDPALANGYGYRSKRSPIELYGTGTLLHRRPRNQPNYLTSESVLLPEMDVVGVIRVLESDEDVEYFETKLDLHDRKCMSTHLYWVLISAVAVLVSIQVVALGVIAIDRYVFERTLGAKFRPSA
uniref:ZP domain-containing protein n=1 Tax=Panagrellus redivivus TaxID=6233 RepID=A0A7E4USV6_PANRE